MTVNQWLVVVDVALVGVVVVVSAAERRRDPRRSGVITQRVLARRWVLLSRVDARSVTAPTGPASTTRRDRIICAAGLVALLAIAVVSAVREDPLPWPWLLAGGVLGLIALTTDLAARWPSHEPEVRGE